MDIKITENYDKFFKKLTKFEPYAFQKEFADKFINSRSIILNAPTGSGKTLAAIAPFVYCWNEWKEEKQKVSDYPRKLIYSLPLRTLANSLYKDVEEMIRENLNLDIKVTLQTGENRSDPYFEGDIIFTTIDQTLSNVLSIPLSLSKGLSNINAGAVLSSYLVFDELHLLEPKKSLSTTLILLDSLKEIVPFCLMTATLSQDFMKKSAKLLDASLISVERNDYEAFSYIQNKAKKFVKTNKEILDAENILRFHKSKTIVICNTVAKCISLYKELKQKSRDPIKLICLHSQFFQKDRKNKEDAIIKYFGQDSSEGNVILIATQIVEVGLDISCETMLTEISPINSFLQRAGRCARWRGEGNIQVFNCEDTYLPYTESLCRVTFDSLEKIHDKQLDYFTSQRLVEDIIAELESGIFAEVESSDCITREQIRESWRTGNRSYARGLIRDIRSISVVLLPKDYKTSSLYSFESFSINPYSLKKKIEDYLEAQQESEPILFTLMDSGFIDEDFDDAEKELATIGLDEIFSENIVALDSNLVGYAPEYGLDFEGNFGRTSKKLGIKEDGKHHIYHCDTYEEHISWMLKYLGKITDYPFALKKIQKLKYSTFNIEEIIKFIIEMHDYGKLDVMWQKIMKTYQERISGKDVSDFLAHSDYDQSSQKDCNLMSSVLKEYRIGKKPPHSGIGGFASFIILQSVLEISSENKDDESFIKAVATSILRHHSSFAKEIPRFNISNEAFKLCLSRIRTIFPGIVDKELKLLKGFKGTKSEDIILSFQKNYEVFLYFILVRILRLCDQHSFEHNPRIKR